MGSLPSVPEFPGFPNPVDWFKQRTLGCYNAFHRTTPGRVIQKGSLFALTALDNNWKNNWTETLLGATGKAAFLTGFSPSAATEAFLKDVAGPVLIGGATVLDGGALAACAGAGLTPPPHP